MAIDLPEFDVTIPLSRLNSDGSRNQHDVRLRMPAVDRQRATEVAGQIAWEIVTNLPSVGDNNRYGWKIASYGVAAEPVNEAS